LDSRLLTDRNKSIKTCLFLTDKPVASNGVCHVLIGHALGWHVGFCCCVGDPSANYFSCISS